MLNIYSSNIPITKFLLNAGDKRLECPKQWQNSKLHKSCLIQ